MFPDMVVINGFDGYFISKCGRVFSIKKYITIKEMVLKEDKDGYYEVGLYRNNKRIWRRVHRLVASTYLDNPNNYPQINHIDGNVKNNNIENLEWCTCSQNVSHSFKVLGRIGNSTTNIPLILQHKESSIEYKFDSQKDASRFLKLSYEHFNKILTGKKDINKCKKLKPYSITLL